MQRIIPKNSKLRRTIFRGFTMLDLSIVCLALLVVLLTFASNIEGKWVIGAVVAVFTATLFIGSGEDRTYILFYYSANFLLSRKRYYKNVQGKRKGRIDDIIPFKSIDNDGVIIYDKYFGAVVEIGSITFGLLDEYEQDSRITAFAQTLNGLSQSGVLQLVKIDRPIDYAEASEILYRKVKSSEAQTDKARTVILKSRQEQIDKMYNVEVKYRPFYYLVLYDDDRNNLYRQVDVARNGIDGAGLSSQMLEGRDVAVFLKYCNTRRFDERYVDEVKEEDYADYIKPEKIKFTYNSYKVDDVYAVTFAIKDYPLYVGNSWGNGIFNIDNTKVVLTIRPTDSVKAVKRLNRVQEEIRSHDARTDSERTERDVHLASVNMLQQSIQNENEMLFDCTLTVTAFNNTQKEDKVFRKEVVSKLQKDGFRISHLFGRQFAGFAASSIARKFKLSGMERGINSDSLAASFPFVFSSIIEPEGFTLGWDYYPVILDIWKRDDLHVNSNMVIFGTSGAGKSFFTKLLLCNVYSENSRIFILDPENEYQKLAGNVGGNYIDVGSATQGRLNPLHIYPVLTDEGEPASPEICFTGHLQFLDSFFRITLNGITSDSLEELNNLVIKMYEASGITRDTDCTQFGAEKFPTFDNLLKCCENELSQCTAPQRRSNLERVKTYIQKFSSGGMYSALWCGPSTLSTDERLVVFNFQSLLNAKNSTVTNAQILVVMRFLDQQIINIREYNRSGAGEIIHPFVVVDEGYKFIDPKYPVALDFVYNWYKRIRKYEGSILFATQNLSDVLGNPEVVAKTSAIVNNSQYSFIFKLPPADLEILSNLYRNAGGINETEHYTIANAKRGECFAICSSRERSNFIVRAHDNVRKLFDEERCNLTA